jgi:hypothetical protein
LLLMLAVWQTKSPPGPRRPMVVDRLKQIPVDTGKSAETAGQQEQGETACKNLARRDVLNDSLFYAS